MRHSQPCLSTIPSWFQSHGGAAYGIIASGTSLGGVIFLIMISHLIDQFGFPRAMQFRLPDPWSLDYCQLDGEVARCTTNTANEREKISSAIS